MDQYDSNDPLASAKFSPLAVNARVDEARRGFPSRVAANFSALFTLVLVGAVVVGVTLRLLGLP